MLTKAFSWNGSRKIGRNMGNILIIYLFCEIEVCSQSQNNIKQNKNLFDFYIEKIRKIFRDLPTFHSCV